MVSFCPLSSGSKGNSIFLGTKNSKVLIDCGISFLSLEKKLNEIDVNINDIDAVLITHEHFDHISGLKLLVEKLNIPVIINADTAKAIYDKYHISAKYNIFTTFEEFEYKDLKIFPFSINHDCVDPVGFVIKTKNQKKIGICTDIGFVTSYVKEALKNCSILYLEANHSIPMVHSSNRSIVYKQRVLSKQGHLSNDNAIKLLKDLIHPDLNHIYLAHLSEECNSQKLVIDLMEKLLEEKKSNRVEYSIAYQDKISKKIVF
ncbi:MAG: MBL fold metallo-hydrolase [Parachlamydiales bacterium]|nr:MBL fold metallo-hydrolase [Parachlamydiales bacterium]